jgi:hypothetical protein
MTARFWHLTWPTELLVPLNPGDALAKRIACAARNCQILAPSLHMCLPDSGDSLANRIACRSTLPDSGVFPVHQILATPGRRELRAARHCQILATP